MNAWIFDIDGVITNLTEEKIDKFEIVDRILAKLQKGEPVALVSGRGLYWIREKVLKKLPSNSPLDLLFVSGEFGGETLFYNNGKETYTADKALLVPQNIIGKASEILVRYSDFTVREPKTTLFTAKIKDGTDLKTFQEAQENIAKEYEKLLEGEGLVNFEVHTDMLGINIRNKRQNKHLAIQKFLEWLEDKNIKINFFTVVGDSNSDLEMGNELHERGKDFVFVYVGEKLGGKEYPFKIVRTSKHYDEGTLEYLISHPSE